MICGMRLSTRLLLLVVVSVLPVIAVQIYGETSLRQRRTEQLEQFALRRAELANADVLRTLDEVRVRGHGHRRLADGLADRTQPVAHLVDVHGVDQRVIVLRLYAL